MCTHFWHCIHALTLFPHHLVPPSVTKPPPGQDLFHPLVLRFCRRVHI
jgi:hypothetical protein